VFIAVAVSDSSHRIDQQTVPRGMCVTESPISSTEGEAAGKVRS
jgi:hypothetical protein